MISAIIGPVSSQRLSSRRSVNALVWAKRVTSISARATSYCRLCLLKQCIHHHLKLVDDVFRRGNSYCRIRRRESARRSVSRGANGSWRKHGIHIVSRQPLEPLECGTITRRVAGLVDFGRSLDDSQAPTAIVEDDAVHVVSQCKGGRKRQRTAAQRRCKCRSQRSEVDGWVCRVSFCNSSRQ